MPVTSNFAPAGGFCAYAYYLVWPRGEPLSMPSNCLQIETWGSRPYVSAVNGPCCGVAWFSRPLSSKEQIVYGLLPSNLPLKRRK